MRVVGRRSAAVVAVGASSLFIARGACALRVGPGRLGAAGARGERSGAHEVKEAVGLVPRRAVVKKTLSVVAAGAVFVRSPLAAAGADEVDFPEEVSGLAVLRVAEVATFQERLLREYARGTDLGVPVTPQQFLFGTKILLRNSNLDGNIRLMVRSEVRRDRREDAIRLAPEVMNALNAVGAAAQACPQDAVLSLEDAVKLADRYAAFRGRLLDLFACLPPDLQSRYTGYAQILADYEKKVSEDCVGGAAGGCLEDDAPPPPEQEYSPPKAGEAPKALAEALKQQNQASSPR